MPTTPRGIEYPDSSGHTRTWEHWQALAETADQALDDVDQDSGWQTPALENGWVASSTEPPRYRKIRGIVFFDGRANGGADFSTVFSLPIGFRPSQNRFVTASQGGANDPCRLVIFADGRVTVDNQTNATNVAFIDSFPI